MQSATLRLVVCASLAAVVLGQRPLPRFENQRQRQLVNPDFGGQINQGFVNSPLDQGFVRQQNIQTPAPFVNNQLDQGFGRADLGRQQNIQTASPFINTRPGSFQRQQQQVIANQQTDNSILEDVRDGPFWDGSYYFRYQSADGTVREEGGRPLADGTIQVTGSYGYRAPNGEIFEMEYIADTLGYRAFKKGTRADFIPPQRALPPQGLPPFQQNFIDNNIVAQPQPRPVARPRPTQTPNNQIRRPINTQITNQGIPINNQLINQGRPIDNQIINPVPAPVQPIINNNFLRPGNQFNTNIRPTPASFQGFGQRNQDILFPSASSDGTFVALDSPENNINNQEGIIFN